MPEIITLDYLCGKRDRANAASGPFWLRDSRIADLVAEALLYGDVSRRLYDVRGWVIMPNHVHVIFEPHVELSGIMRWLKGRTARSANRLLGRSGAAFWQEESFDHWIRSDSELRQLIDYVENNPVKAGLVEGASEWRWSSAWGRAA